MTTILGNNEKNKKKKLLKLRRRNVKGWFGQRGKKKMPKTGFFYFVRKIDEIFFVVANIMFRKFISHYNLRSQYTYLIKIRVRFMILNFFMSEYITVPFGYYVV